MSHLVIMAAGTGGHIIPGLAVAREMQERGWSVSWLGTRTGMENQLVPPAGIALDTIAISGLRGKSFVQTALGGLRLLKAFWDCLQILRRRGAQAVLGMGGYICFPGGLMASLLGRPLLLMNADAELLLSNKALLPVADRVLFGFEGGGAAKVKGAVVCGNPVRAEIEAVSGPAQRYAGRTGPLRMLVVGGSLGARSLNELVPAALALMAPQERPLVMHQSGHEHVEKLRQAYATARVTAVVVPFIDDMAERMANCDFMVCRAGAITVSELCAAGVPALLVPLVARTTTHQRDNAAWLAAKGAALHLKQAELTPPKLAETLRRLQRSELLELARRARALARPQAAARVADELEKLAGRAAPPPAVAGGGAR
jgi:UDP-N-acetylglucosamine--N-acetylmuramyl-(pentapeptide) pyrophosphoryl-undecaprenol N-acetylglucosamine transferase